MIDIMHFLMFFMPVVLLAALPFGATYYGWSQIQRYRGNREAGYFFGVCLLVFISEFVLTAFYPMDPEWSIFESVTATLSVIGFYLAIIAVIWVFVASRRSR